jgi:predicted DNA-binding protein
MKRHPKEAIVMKPTTLRLPVDLIQRGKIHAVKTGDTLQAIVARALDAYLNAHEKEAR